MFCREPIHDEVRRALEESGAGVALLSDLERRPFASAMWLSREFDVIQLNLIAPRSRLALVAFAAWPAKVTFVDRVSGPSEGDRPRPLPFRILDWLTMKRVYEVAGITEYVAERAKARFTLPSVRTLYNGVDAKRFHPPESHSSGGAVRLAVVSSLIPEKGVDVLLSALAGLDDVNWTLSIIGEGPERTRLEGMIQGNGFSTRVQLLGLRDDVPEQLRGADILVHPATWQEALGNVILEAMASGCAVIASRTGGIPELLVDGEEGVLVQPGDAEALRSSLRRLMGDASLRQRLGENARQRVEADFTLEASVRATIDWYEKAAMKGRVR